MRRDITADDGTQLVLIPEGEFLAGDGKFIELEISKMKNLMKDETAELIYSDGRYSPHGLMLFRKPEGVLILLTWTNGLGEDDIYEIISPKDALLLLQQQRHPRRVANAIEALGFDLEEEN